MKTATPNTELTERFSPYLREVTELIKNDESISLKVSSLRRFARKFTREFIQNLVLTIDLDELNNISEIEDLKDNIFLRRLDGKLLKYNSSTGMLLISTICPFINFFWTFTEETFLEQYRRAFKNHGPVHPFCIVHQIIREELLSRISKGPLFTHPVLIASRDMNTGRFALSDDTLSMTGLSEEEFKNLLNNYACAFLVL